MGAREVLTKPNDVEELVTLMQGVHERWLADEQPIIAAVASVPEWQTRQSGVALRLPPQSRILGPEQRRGLRGL